MLRTSLQKAGPGPLNVLCLGAHCDDIEIGCGGTILTLIDRFKREVEFHWAVFSSTPERGREAKACAESFLKDVAKKTIVIDSHRDGFFPYVGGTIKDSFEQLKQTFNPDVIFTHYRDDRHQDHRIISELTWNTYRDHFILEYEIPKYDGDLGSPNFFVHLDEAVCKKRNSLILEGFVSQRGKHWFDEETFLALARLRGMESAAPGKYAEAFYCRKAVW